MFVDDEREIGAEKTGCGGGGGRDRDRDEVDCWRGRLEGDLSEVVDPLTVVPLRLLVLRDVCAFDRLEVRVRQSKVTLRGYSAYSLTCS